MKRVFIAGLYSKKPTGEPANHLDLMDNIRRGIYLATVLLTYGFAPYCPWLDYQYFLLNKHITTSHVHDMDLAWLMVCDAVLMKDPLSNIPDNSQVLNENIPDNSQVLNEIAFAERLGIPVFETIDDMVTHFEEEEYD
jgi:hypothetical protein